MLDLRSTRVLCMFACAALALTASVLIEPGRILARSMSMETIEGFLASIAQPTALTPDAHLGPDVENHANASALALAIGVSDVERDLFGAERAIGFSPAAFLRSTRRVAAPQAEGSQWEDREYRLAPGPRNYRGELVKGAPTRYFQDFEGDSLGTEWVTKSRLGFSDHYTGHLGPTRLGEHTLHINVDRGRAYAVRFDLYLTAGDRASEASDGEFTVFVDGVPLLESTFAQLVEQNYKLNGLDEGFDPGIVQGVLVPFVSVAPVAEITWEYDADVALGAGAWGLDNVLVELGVINPGAFGGGGGFTSLGGPENPGKTHANAEPHGNTTSVRGNPTGPGGGGGSRPSPFDISDFLPDPADEPSPEDEPDDFFETDPPTEEDPPIADPPTNDDPPLPDPPNDGPDDDPFERDPPDDDLPTPGGGALLIIAGLASMRRGRRERAPGC